MIKHWCQELSCFPEAVWISYAKSRDPLQRLVSLDEYTSHFHAARKCGMDLAHKARREWGGISCQEMAEQLGVRVERLPMPEGDGMLTFAMYHEPDLIQVFTDNAAATETLIRESGSGAFIQSLQILYGLTLFLLFQFKYMLVNIGDR